MKEETKEALLDLLFKPAATSPMPGGDPSGMHIAVLDRGFVYVGHCQYEGDWLRITNAKNIRVWGTKKGLGELRTGPTAETELDEAGTILVPRRGVMHLMVATGF